MLKISENIILHQKKIMRHYYGDEVRMYFIIGAAIMILTLPFLKDLVPVSVEISILLITILGIVAGLTNPLQTWVNSLNLMTSLAATVIFEYYGVTITLEPMSSTKLLFFFTNQVLAITFFLAFYYSVKTIRGIWLRGRNNNNQNSLT